MARQEGLEAILSCVDRGLAAFGSDFKRVVYWRFSSICGKSRNDIIAKPEEFQTFLQNTFGRGAKVIEREIVGEIGLECNLSLQDPFDIVKAIQHAKNQLLVA